MDISLTELEQAINFWRGRRPSTGEERALSPEVDRLATVYALMIFERAKSFPASRLDEETLALIQGWRKAAG